MKYAAFLLSLALVLAGCQSPISGVSAGGTLDGRVRFARGENPQSIQVSLDSGQSATVASDGRFSFPNLKSASYTVTIESPWSVEKVVGYLIQVRSGEVATVPLVTLTAVGKVSGTVSFVAGGFASGAEVWFPGSPRATVAADGTYLLAEVPSGIGQTLRIAKAGYAPVLKPVDVVAFQSNPAGVVSLEVQNNPEVVSATNSLGRRSWGFDSASGWDQPRQLSLQYTVPTGGANVYYLFTNVNVTGAVGLDGSGTVPNMTPERLKVAQARTPIRDFPGLAESGFRALQRARSAASLPGRAATSPVPEVPSLLSQWTFIDSLWGNGPSAANYHSTTLRKQVTAAGSSRILNIWVADDAWDSDANGTPDQSSPGLTHGVNQTMVDGLADRFLKSTGTDDIYHWVTTIYGPEWSSGVPAGGDGELINGGGQINIVLVNLNPGGTADGVMMGYFHSLNNALGIQGSNEKILFALDADSLAYPEGPSWEITDYWPAEVVSTLAHEFQHMIHYYQKQVLHPLVTTWTDTWIDEMSSLVTEDLVADKLQVPGPRGRLSFDSGSPGLLDGRIPYFNFFHEVVPLTAWGGDYGVLPSYANAYAFGAWLVRNYGGPGLFHDIVTGDKTDYRAVVEAVQKVDPSATFGSLVRDWGAAVFLGVADQRAGLNFQSSSGDSSFSWTWGGLGYKAGSINPSNYRIYYGANGSKFLDGPWVYRDGILDSSRGIAAGATYYHWAGLQAEGDHVADVSVPAGTALTLVVQP